MDLSSTLRSLPVFAAVALTPLLIRLWGKLSPPAELGTFETFYDLRDRNGWLNFIYTLFSFIGLLLPFALFGRKLNSIGWPALGFAFGSAVVLPWTVIGVLTLPSGFSRYHEFWRYYEQRYRIGLPGITVVYVPLALFGALSVAELVRRGIW